MKKNLLATTAMVAAGALVSTGALAESKPISLKVGGYFEQWVGFASVDNRGTDVQDLDVQEDGEIHFKGSTTLDNGLTFGVNVQLETQSSNGGTAANDDIDEAYLFVRGDFGEIVLGSENGAAYAMHYGFSSNGLGLNTGDHQNWIVGNDFTMASTYEFARRDNDSEKIRWISPRWSGVQIGASYAPEATQDDDGFPTEATNHATNEEGVWAVSANYDGKFDDFRVRASAGYQGFFDDNSTAGVGDSYAMAFGVKFGFGGFSLEGSYAHAEGAGLGGAATERDVFGGSVLYNSGPVGVSLAVVYGEEEGAGGFEDEQVAVELGGKYKLGPGVEAKGSLFYGDRETTGMTDNSGFAVVGGIRLVF